MYIQVLCLVVVACLISSIHQILCSTMCRIVQLTFAAFSLSTHNKNLDNWKSSRRKRVEHIIDRVVETKKLEEEEHDRTRRKSKTFTEMMEERQVHSNSKRSRRVLELVILSRSYRVFISISISISNFPFLQSRTRRFARTRQTGIPGSLQRG